MPEAVLVAVSGALAGRARRYAAVHAGYQFGAFALWLAAWAGASLLVPRAYRALAWVAWGGYVAGGAGVIPPRGWARFACPPGTALRLGVELLLWALARSGAELARGAAWLVVALREGEGEGEGQDSARPPWLRPEVEGLARAFLIAAGVAREEGGRTVYPEPGEIIQGPSGDAGAATSLSTDRSRAGSPPP